MNSPLTSNPSAERARMESFYNSLSLRDGVAVGWGRDRKTGTYHASFARNAWAAWQEARRPVHETTDSRRVERLENAVREAIYEVTHLSSAAWDGYYTPRIHNQAVDRWRAALRPAVEPTVKPVHLRGCASLYYHGEKQPCDCGAVKATAEPNESRYFTVSPPPL